MKESELSKWSELSYRYVAKYKNLLLWGFEFSILKVQRTQQMLWYV